MKKAFICSFTAVFLAWLITSATYSQNLSSTAKLKLQPVSQNILSSDNETGPGSIALNEMDKNEINSKILRNFTRRYKNIEDAKWFKSSEGLFVAFFTIDQLQTFIYYNEKGNFEFMMRYYKEDRLPADIRHLVKSTYYDFSIYLVTEITRNGKTAYAVKMEDKTLWKTVKVVDGEMELMEEYSKR